MDPEKKKVYEIIEKVREIMAKEPKLDGRGFSLEEIKRIVNKYIPNHDETLLNKQLENVEFVQINDHAIVFTFEVEALLYNMLYHSS